MNKKIIKLFFTISMGMYFFLYSPIFSSGIYEVRGDNITSLGIDIQDDSSTLSADASGFQVDDGSILILSRFTIQEDQSWDNLVINFDSGIGNVDITLRDSNGSLLQKVENQSTTLNIDLQQFESTRNGKPITLVLVFHNNIKITSIQISYSGEGVIGYPSPFSITKETFKIAYDLPNDALVTLKIYDRRGRIVKTLLNDTFVSAKGSPRENPNEWDGTNEQGSKVSSGIYIIYLEVKFSNFNNWSEDIRDYTSTFKFLVYQ